MRRLAAVLYPDFELLDLYGPLEMFGSLREQIEILTVAESAGPVRSYQGPATVADASFDAAPDCELLLIPGGLGTLPQLANEALLAYLRKAAAQAEYQWHEDAANDPFVALLNQANALPSAD